VCVHLYCILSRCFIDKRFTAWVWSPTPRTNISRMHELSARALTRIYRTGAEAEEEEKGKNRVRHRVLQAACTGDEVCLNINRKMSEHVIYIRFVVKSKFVICVRILTPLPLNSFSQPQHTPAPCSQRVPRRPTRLAPNTQSAAFEVRASSSSNYNLKTKNLNMCSTWEQVLNSIYKSSRWG